MKKSAQVRKGLASLRSRSGFTLVELLVVIAIIAILAAVVVLIINPIELTRRGRDAARFTDLANLQQAINVAVQEATASTATILCNGAAAPCGGSANGGSSNVTGRASDGTGWLKVNISSAKSVSVPVLPVDPTNNLVNHYTYCSDGNAWEIAAVLESDQQRPKMGTYGGNNPNIYAVGSNLNLIPTTGVPCAY